MYLKLPTAIQLQTIARGKPNTNEIFSKNFPLDQAKTTSLLATFSKSISPQARSSALLNQDIPHQFFVPIIKGPNDMTAIKFTAPSLQTIGDVDYVIGSLTDSMTNLCPSGIHTNIFFGKFTTLVSASDIDKFNLLAHDTAPDNIAIPPSEGDGAEEEGPSIARLNWAKDDNEVPAITALPFLFPIPPGMDFPEKIDLLTYSPPDDVSYHPFAMWRRAIVYVATTNDSFSVTKGGNLFDITTFDESWTEFLGKVTLDGDALKCFTPITDPAAHKLTIDHLQAVMNGVYHHFGASVPTTPPPGTTTPTTPQTIEVKIADHQSKADKEMELHSKIVAAKWGITFGKVDKDTKKFIPATIPDTFSALLSKTNKAAVLRDTKSYADLSYNDMNNQSTKLSAFVSLSSGHITAGFVTCVRNFQVFQDLPLANLSSFKECLSPAQFLPLIKDSVSWTRTNDETETLLQGEYAVKTPSDQSKGYLYFGKLETLDDVLAMIANFKAFFGYMIPDSSTSALFANLSEYTTLLLDKDTKAWLETYKSHDSIIPNVFQDVVQMVGAYFKVGDNPIYFNAHTKGDTLPHTLYDRPALLSTNIMRNLTTDVNCSRITYYGPRPSDLIAMFHPASPGGKKRIADSPAKGGKNGSPKDDDGKKKLKQTPNKNIARDDPSATKGMFVYKQDPLPALIPFITGIRVKNPATKTNEQICQYFATRGFVCTSAKCKKVHLASTDKLDDATKQKLSEFVAKSDNNYDWAPGRAPTSGN